VRLNSVVRSVRNSYLTSVCDPDDATAIKAVDTLLMSRTSGGCLNTAVAARADGTPDCVVEDVTAYPDGSVSRREIPSCAENGNVTPCWALVDRLAQYDAQGCQPLPPSPSTCKLPPTCQPIIDPVDGRRELYTVTVERGANAAPPPGTTTNISCATIPPSP
jgi:hypothetical protein